MLAGDGGGDHTPAYRPTETSSLGVQRVSCVEINYKTVNKAENVVDLLSNRKD